MMAIVTKQAKNGVKSVSGKVIMDGALSISIVVHDKNGAGSIKRFNKSDCKVSFYE